MRIFVAFLLMMLVVGGAAPLARAQLGEMRIIRDTEIEMGLRQLATPVIRAAGHKPEDIRFILIQNSDLNAFVAGGMNIFLNTGLIQQAEHPGQLIGVIAHELGHIAGGHLVRGREAAKYAGVQTILGTLAAVAAGVAAGSPEAGLFVLGGTQDTARRTFFTHSRAQEGSADAAALEYLNRASINPSGLGEFLQKLASQELLPYDRQSEWVRTHPITLDRVDTVQTHVMDSPLRNQPLPHEWKTLLARIQAKLVGFLQPEQALLRYTDHDSRWAARYARAIALYRTNNMPRALAILDELEKTETTNPYLYELRGQILLENSKPRDAAAAYAKAIKLLPQAPLINIAYARALLESRDDNQIPLALTQIQTALQKEPREPESWRLLATGWGRLGELGKEKNSAGLVAYALAEEAMSKGDAKVALPLVKRALEQLPKDHPLWLKASDLRLAVEKVIEKN